MTTKERRVTPRKLKGFQDFSPEMLSLKHQILASARQQAELAGFSEIATPVLEYADALFGTGEETDKQIFQFLDNGDRKVAMRFDLTIPFARYAAEHRGKYPLPFKKLQIGNVFRAEKPQKGRFREFCQCDLDIIGVNSPHADLEVLSCLFQTLDRILSLNFTMKLNDRRILSHLLSHFLEIPENREQEALIIIDKLDKISEVGVREQLTKHFEAKPDSLDLFFEVLNGDKQQVLKQLADTPEIHALYKQLMLNESILNKFGSSYGKAIIDLSIARGLGYYTGIVFETIIDDHKGFGAICSGGRYDQLAERFGQFELPGVGGSIGVDRLISLLQSIQVNSTTKSPPVSILLADNDAFEQGFQLALELRQQGIPTGITLKQQKLAPQLKNLSKNQTELVIIAGSAEITSETWTLKDMQENQQFTQLKKTELIGKLSEILARRK